MSGEIILTKKQCLNVQGNNPDKVIDIHKLNIHRLNCQTVDLVEPQVNMHNGEQAQNILKDAPKRTVLYEQKVKDLLQSTKGCAKNIQRM